MALGCRDRLSVEDVRDGAVLVEVDVQPLLVVVLGYHHARRDDAVLLGQVLLAERLQGTASQRRAPLPRRPGQLTVPLDSVSDIFLPTSLFCHCSIVVAAVVTPGTTRGMMVSVVSWSMRCRSSGACTKTLNCETRVWLANLEQDSPMTRRKREATDLYPINKLQEYRRKLGTRARPYRVGTRELTTQCRRR